MSYYIVSTIDTNRRADILGIKIAPNKGGWNTQNRVRIQIYVEPD